MKLSELAKKCEYEYCGPDREISSIRFAGCADTDSIAITNSERDIEQTKAMCVLTRPVILSTDKSLLFVSDSIELASVKVANILYEHKIKEIFGVISYKRTNNYYCGDDVVIGKRTYIAPDVYIDSNVVIGDDCVIGPNIKIGSDTNIGNNVRIAMGSSIGANSFYHYFEDGLKEFPGVGGTIIEDNVCVGNNTIIQRGTFSDTRIGTNSKIGNLVDVGHDVCIGSNCKIVSQSGIAGNVSIGDFVQIFGQAGIANNVRIGDYATVMAKSLVSKNVSSHKTVSGIYAREHTEELKIKAKIRKL